MSGKMTEQIRNNLEKVEQLFWLIDCEEKRIKENELHLEGRTIATQFPRLMTKAKHNIEIQVKAKQRLTERLKILLTEIKETL